MPDFRRFLRWLSFAVLGFAAWGLVVGPSAGSAEPIVDLPSRVRQWVAELADDRFAVREEAHARLQKLAADPATAAEVRRLLAPFAVSADVSFEVREVVRTLARLDTAATERKKLDEWFVGLDTTAMSAALETDFANLDADAFEKRDHAAGRLSLAAQAPSAAGPLLWQIHLRLDRAPVSPDAARVLRSSWETALRTWIKSDPPSTWKPPIDARQEIDAALDRLASASERPGVTPWAQRAAVAERELLFLLSIEAYVPILTDAVRLRLGEANLSPAAAGRLERIEHWTRPAMAAEFWQAGRHHSTQHLLIGVPNQPAGAPRPSLFDRCDERFAHCVSGNSLATGDHPVGVFFPHPNELQGQAQFHLVNLPTPRRRLAYEVEAPTAAVSSDELLRIDQRRRREITARTGRRILEEKRRLTDREIDMLGQLDPVEAARFAEKYLLAVNDERYESGSPQSFGNGSLHGWLCYVLSTLGVPEAGRAVAAAVDKNRILEPTAEKPYRIEWVAALSLAETAPWPDVDRWLAAQLDRTEAIHIGQPQAADVGASCAARMLLRAGRNPADFFLTQHEFPELIDLENPGYRFTQPEGRDAVKAWWRERQAAAAQENPVR